MKKSLYLFLMFLFLTCFSYAADQYKINVITGKMDIAGPMGLSGSNNNIGIGSLNPGQTLDVQGTVRAISFQGDGSQLTGISGSSPWSRTAPFIYPATITDNVGIGTSTPQGLLQVVGAGNVGIGTVNPTGLFQIVGTGNVGIGSTAPGQILDVQGTIRATSIMAPMHYIKITNTQSSGVGGGDATAGSWIALPVNTKDTDTGIDVVSNSGGTFVLVAGTYDIWAYSPFLQCGGFQTRLQNTTDASTVLIGTTGNAGTADTTQHNSVLMGRFTIAASKNLQYQYQVNSTKATIGLGNPMSYGTEVFTTIVLQRVS